jgi:hypothetical protein
MATASRRPIGKGASTAAIDADAGEAPPDQSSTKGNLIMLQFPARSRVLDPFFPPDP